MKPKLLLIIKHIVADKGVWVNTVLIGMQNNSRYTYQPCVMCANEVAQVSAVVL